MPEDEVLTEEITEAASSVVSEAAVQSEPASSGMSIDLDAILQTLTETVSTYGINILAAIVIFVVGRIVARFVTARVRKIMEARQVEASLVGFACSMVHAIMLIFVVLAALGKLGIQTTSFVAIIGAAGLAIGLALQGSLSNFAAGVIILIFKPYKVGDYVVAGGGEGIIEEDRYLHHDSSDA